MSAALSVTIWLVAIFTGVTPRDHELSTPEPHSPRPPETGWTPVPPGPGTSGWTGNNRSTAPMLPTESTPVTKTFGITTSTMTFLKVNVTLSSKANTTSFKVNTSSSMKVNPTSLLTVNKSSLLNISSSLNLKVNTTSSTLKPLNVNDTRFSSVATKEVVMSVPLQKKGLFIRRKHKGPFHEKRVKKLYETLNGMKKVKRFNITDGNMVSPSSRQVQRTTERPLGALNKSDVIKKAVMSRGRKRFSMGIPASSTVLLDPPSHAVPSTTKATPPTTPLPTALPTTPNATPTASPTTSPAAPIDSDEYYSSYADYPDLSAVAYNTSGYGESAVLPDPEPEPEVEAEAEAEVEAEVEAMMPDDSLADTDLHDHDLIDSVMYIYFGSAERDERGAGRQVLVVGAVISLVAQCLTMVSVVRRIRSPAHPREPASVILLNAEIALTAANLVFMFGVQATSSRRCCELVAIALHYLHLSAGAWLLVNSVFAFGELRRPDAPRRPLRPWALAAWALPAAVVTACVVFNRRGYETRAFCWVSVARGMLYSFMVPVAFLLLLNTWLAVEGLRRMSCAKSVDHQDRKSMRVSAVLLPVFAVVWFLGVVALENSASLVFPLLFVASNGFLNWFILACWLPADLTPWRESDEDYCDEDDDDLYETEEALKQLLEEPVSAPWACGRRPDPYDLQMDPICTISS